MGWFRSSVQPQQDHVFEIVNPLFGQTAQGEQEQQQQRECQQKDASTVSFTQMDRPADVWDQHGAASAPAALLRSPAGLRQSDSSGVMQMQQGMPSHTAPDGPSHSSNSNSGRISSSGMRGHAPAPLLLPADEPPACAGAAGDSACQGFADEGCYTPGTVGSTSPQGPLHVPAAHVKASAHAGPMPAATAAKASVSTSKAAHRLSCSTPMGVKHEEGATHWADSDAQHAGQHSVVSLQSPASGSSSGNWSECSAGTSGVGSPATVSGIRLTAGHAFSPAASLPATPTAGRLSHAGAAQQQQRGASRPVSALQRQLQMQLQPQQQGNQEAAAAAAAADGDEDDLLADLTACLESLEVAAQLARTQSGMKPDKLPASIAAFRQSSAGGACSRSNSSRYSSGGKTDLESGTVAASAGSSTMLRSSGSDGSAAAAAVAAAGANSNSSSDGLGSEGMRPAAGTQLIRGRSRLQTTTSNACLWDPQADDVFDDEFNEGSQAYTQASLQHAGASGNHGGLVLQKVGERSKAVPLADASKAPSSPCRSSSNRSSTGSGSSSREGSVHDGQRSNFRHSLDVPATGYNTGVPSRRAASAAGAQPRPAPTPKHTQVSAQEEYERYQRALVVQQEQQQLQERRQHKQEQVVASYSCLSPHSPHRPTSHSSTRSDGGFSTSSSSSSSSSRPSSSKDTPPAASAAAASTEACGRASTGGKWTLPASTDPAAALSGNTTVACCPEVTGTAPSSLEDAWAAIQARTGVPAAAPPASLQPGPRPTLASARPTPASAGSLGSQGVYASGVPGVLLSSGGSVPLSKAAGGGQAVGFRVSAPGAGVLQVPLPPSCRPGSAGGSPSPRAKSSAAAAAAASGAGAAFRGLRQA